MREIVVGQTYQFIFNKSFGFHTVLEKHNRELCEVRAISAYEDDHIIYDVRFSDGFQYCVFDEELFMPKPDYKLLDSISRIQIM